MNKFQSYCKNILIAIDQLVSAILLGDPDETISSRLGKAHRGDYGRGWCYTAYLPWLFTNCIFTLFGPWGHCESSIEEDRGNACIDLTK